MSEYTLRDVLKRLCAECELVKRDSNKNPECADQTSNQILKYLADEVEGAIAREAELRERAEKAEQRVRELEAGGARGVPSLTFNAFRAANIARCKKWHPRGIESWSPSDWLTATTGELGELASLLKMRNRERDGLPGNKFSPTQKQIADELADTLTYLDLLAEVLGVNLGEAAVEKFNEVSERVGFSDRIELTQVLVAEHTGSEKK